VEASAFSNVQPRANHAQAEAVIVDEAAMVDLPLVAWLLRFVGPPTRLEG
jgi:tRNA(Met) C34 N-acetyltransferase TmcA